MTGAAQDTTPKTVGLTLRLPAELAEALKNYAFITDSSGNEVIKRALIQYLQANGREDVMRSAFDRVVEQHGKALDKLAGM
jgi:hypothetical protein